MSPPKGAPSATQQRFDRLIGVLRADMVRYAFWLCRDAPLAEDVVQEAMVRAWRSLDSLRDDGSAKTWLITIVRRELARVFERKRLELADIDDLTAAETALVASSDDHELDDLRRAIFRLGDDYREPLVLQVLLGYTTEEIAALMDLKQATVLTRLHRARKKLLELMGQGIS